MHDLLCLTSLCVFLQVHDCFFLLCKVSRRKRCRKKLSNIPLKTATQLIEYLPCVDEVVSWWHDFVPYPFVHAFLQPDFYCIVSRHVSMRDFSEITCPSSGNLNNIAANQRVVLFVPYSVLNKETH